MILAAILAIAVMAKAQDSRPTTSPTTQPTTQPVTATRITVAIPAAMHDFGAILALAKGPNYTLIEPDGSKVYTLAGTIAIPASKAGLRILLNNNPISVTLGASGRALDIRQCPDFRLDGFHVVQNPGKMSFALAGPNTVISNGTFMNYLESGCQADYPAGNGSQFINLKFLAPCGGRGVYVNGADDTVTDNVVMRPVDKNGKPLPGSLGEDCYRVNTSETGHVPQNTLVMNCQFYAANANNKAAASFRAANGVYYVSNWDQGGVRTGENGAGDGSVTDAHFINNVHQTDTRGVWQQITNFGGKLAEVRDTFQADNKTQCISVNLSQGATVNAVGNTLVNKKGQTYKQLIRYSDGTESMGTNTKVVTVP